MSLRVSEPVRRSTLRVRFPFYVRILSRLWGDRGSLLLFATGTAVFALANGVMAVCAGLLAQALTSAEHAHELARVDPLASWASAILGRRSEMVSAGLSDPT